MNSIALQFNSCIGSYNAYRIEKKGFFKKVKWTFDPLMNILFVFVLYYIYLIGLKIVVVVFKAKKISATNEMKCSKLV